MPTDSTTLPPSPGMAAPRVPLRRTRDDTILAGVCGGLARTLGVPALAVRLVALAVAVAVTPVALIAYAGLAVAMPRDDGRALIAGRPDDRRETIVGVALVVLAVISLAAGIHESVIGGHGGLWVLAVGAVLLLVHHGRRGSDPQAPSSPEPPAGPAAGRPHRVVESPYPGPSRTTAAAASDPTVTMPLGTPAADPAPRGGSVALYGLAAVIGAGAIALVLGAAGAFDATATGVAIALGAGAAALTVAAVALARRRGAFALVALAAVLALGAAATAAVGDDVADGIGGRTRVVSDPAQLSSVQRHGIGQLVVDVERAALPATGDATLTARLGIGELVIRVPRGVAVVSTGPETPSGLGDVNAAAGPAPQRTLRVNADVDAGEVRIEAADR